MVRRGFTLIELLVVITIIALMISILVPVLGAVRTTAIGTLCLANQSQLTVGVHQHAADNKGEIPYGPIEPGSGQLNGADDFYFINGMTTSQISSKLGDPVGAGRMIDLYLGDSPQVLFCPGADQNIKAQEELARVGTGSVISSYIYRHGSNTRDELLQAIISQDRLDDPPRIGQMGKNSLDQDVSALFIDNNFILVPGSSFYDAFHRSNHEEKFVNIAYVDGHAEQRDNSDGKYSANIIGTNLYVAVNLMRDALERADSSE